MRTCTSDGNQRVGPRGFTLIELLIAIVVVALLLGILLPALSGARRNGDVTKCLANLRSIHQASMVYAGANGETWPNAFAKGGKLPIWLIGSTQYEPQDPYPQLWLWVAVLKDAGLCDARAEFEAFSCPAVLREVREDMGANPQMGPLKSYCYSPAFFTDPKLWDPALTDRSTRCNEFWGRVRVSSVAFPAGKVAFFEFADRHGGGEVIGSVGAPPTHQSNVAFADGHVARVRPNDAVPALEFDWNHFFGPTTPAALPFACSPGGCTGRDY
ncbi:MAG: type II secretion system protein [Phycisphaerales bacterium]|nr:type II secretion system protein [Phycisphaerales bacterium]